MSDAGRIAALEAENAALRRRLVAAGLDRNASAVASPEVVAVLHRTRNTLAMVRAIIRRSADSDRSTEDCMMRLDGRLGAIARVQSAGIADPSAGLDLHSIVADALMALLAREGERVLIAGPKVLLAPRAAEVFALAAHELASNAMEHGALTVPDGRIAVAWTLDPGRAAPTLSLDWTETGLHDLPADSAPLGFGTEMLTCTLRYELGAETTLAYRPEGLHCTIRFALTPRIGRVVEPPPGDGGDL